MTRPAMHELQLELGSLRELFDPPGFDPLAGDAEESSGIDRLATSCGRCRGRRSARASCFPPANGPRTSRIAAAAP
jgi:hypothetical protein